MDRNTKLKEYAKLHFNMISWKGYLAAALSGVVSALVVKHVDFSDYGIISNILILIFILIFAEYIIPYIDKICSVMLYQKEAYFYQSFPVTAFHTVLVKTLSLAVLIAVIPASYLITEYIYMGMQSITFAIAVILLCIALGLLVSGIILTGYRIGNNFRSQKKPRPNKLVSYLVIFAATGLLILLWKFVNRIHGISYEIKLYILAVILLLLGVMLFIINVYSLKKNYEV